MSRPAMRSSLFLKEAAFHDAAVEATSHVGDDLKDNPNALNDTEAMITIARRFLNSSAPSLLDVLDNHDDVKSSSDRLVKVGRNVSSTMRHARRTSSTANLLAAAGVEQQQHQQQGNSLPPFSKEKIDASLGLLAEESSDLASLLTGEAPQVPKVRFGKTEVEMPVITLGCMRFQQSWDSSKVEEMTKVEDDCQNNLVNIIRHAHHCGINHIETAKAYGSSQLQIGFALKTLFDSGEIKREDLIIQTKGGISSSMTIKDYKEQIVQSIDLLQLDYIDLFAVHGLNTQMEYDLLFDNPMNNGENLIVAVQELKQEGKIRHIGFSTHGPADLTRRAIETGCFDYVNLHYHFCGSYTASGDGECAGNLSNIRLAHEKDMGLFIISAFDKGGRLYAPSNKLRDLCLPDFEPMSYGCVWLWQHAMHDEKKAPCHTLSIGAARPSDLDQAVLASHLLLSDQEDLAERRQRVSNRLAKAMEDVLGKDWVDSWHVGVPNAHTSTHQTHHTGIVWAYNLIQAWGMLDFAKDRYGPMENHLKKWSVDKTKAENIKAMGPGFGWMPGTAFDASLDYTIDFEKCPDKNKEQLLKAIQFVHDLVSKKKNEITGNKEDGKEQKELEEERTIPLDWEVAYDMRPWSAFPER